MAKCSSFRCAGRPGHSVCDREYNGRRDSISGESHGSRQTDCARGKCTGDVQPDRPSGEENLGAGGEMKQVRLDCPFVQLSASDQQRLVFSSPPILLEGVTFSSTVRDRHGTLLRFTTASDQRYRVRTGMDEVPEDLVEAVMKQEDRGYWQHIGVNPFSLLRAEGNAYRWTAIRCLDSDDASRSASLSPEYQNDSGQALQILYALRIERNYDKAQILEAYFNLAPYGRNIEGVGAASLIYFGKRPKELSRQEILALAVLPQSPAKRLPFMAPIRNRSCAPEKD